MGCWGMGIKKSSHKVSEPHDYSGIYFSEEILGLDGTVENLLLVDRFQDLSPAPDRRLYKCLTLTQLQKRFGFFVLLFVLLKGLVNVFAVFRIDDQHIFPLFWDSKDRGSGGNKQNITADL